MKVAFHDKRMSLKSDGSPTYLKTSVLLSAVSISTQFSLAI